MKKLFLPLFFFVLFCSSLQLTAQFDYEPVFPEEEGETLIDLIDAAYSPAFTLSTSVVRDLIYDDIYRVNDSVYCVYTRYSVYLTPGEDPSNTVFEQGINLEHTVPKSLLSNSPAENDMHNLYPTRVEVNTARSNYPFFDIPDTQTDRWYYLSDELNSIPSENIDAYSEWVNGTFEPREDHKGNVARAVFYMQSIWGNVMSANNPDFFEAMRTTLCLWHDQDPVDEAEWERTWQIAGYQGNNPNPFVLDCTLPFRTYCGDVGLICTPPNSVVENYVDKLVNARVAPNPFSDNTALSFTLPQAATVTLTVYNALGMKEQVLYSEAFNAGDHRLPIIVDTSESIKFLQLSFSQQGNVYTKVLPLISLP